MNRKIKISESQLKKLVNETSIGSIEISLAKEVAPMIKQKLNDVYRNSETLDLGIFTRALEHELRKMHTEESEVDNSMEGFEDTSLYEQKEKIKTTFQRFL